MMFVNNNNSTTGCQHTNRKVIKAIIYNYSMSQYTCIQATVTNRIVFSLFVLIDIRVYGSVKNDVMWDLTA